MKREFKNILSQLHKAKAALQKAEELMNATDVQWDGDPVLCALESVDSAEDAVNFAAEENP